VNGERAVVSLTPLDRFGAATFEQGLVGPFLLKGRVPPEPRVSDALGWASGALGYHLSIEPGAHSIVDLAMPFHDPGPTIAAAGTTSPAEIEAVRAKVVREWAERVGRVEVTLPPAASKLVDTLRTTLAHILINRDGPAIQPGSRTYARHGSGTGRSPPTRCCRWATPTKCGAFSRGTPRTNCPMDGSPVASIAAAPIPCPSTTAPASSSTPSRSTIASPATSASCTGCGRRWRGPSTGSPRRALRARPKPIASPDAECSTGCSPNRSATRATAHTRCTRIGTTSSRSAA